MNDFTQADLMALLTREVGLPVADQTDDPGATFADVGLDSLAYLAMQTALAEERGVEMPDDSPTRTFGEIVSIVGDGAVQRASVQA